MLQKREAKEEHLHKAHMEAGGWRFPIQSAVKFVHF